MSEIQKINPSLLKIVTDPAHHLFDERHDLPVSRSLVESIKTNGFDENKIIVVEKDPVTGDLNIVSGRQRVKAAERANEELTKAVLSTVEVPYLIVTGSNIDQVRRLIRENEMGQVDSVVVKAQKAVRLMKMIKAEQIAKGIKEKDADKEARASAAVDFGVDARTITRWEAVLTLPKPILRAIDDGKIGTMTAERMAGMSHEDALKLWEETKSGGKGGKADAKKINAKAKAIKAASKATVGKSAEAKASAKAAAEKAAEASLLPSKKMLKQTFENFAIALDSLSEYEKGILDAIRWITTGKQSDEIAGAINVRFRKPGSEVPLVDVKADETKGSKKAGGKKKASGYDVTAGPEEDDNDDSDDDVIERARAK